MANSVPNLSVCYELVDGSLRSILELLVEAASISGASLCFIHVSIIFPFSSEPVLSVFGVCFMLDLAVVLVFR